MSQSDLSKDLGALDPDNLGFPLVCKIVDFSSFEIEAKRLITHGLTELDFNGLAELRNDYLIYRERWHQAIQAHNQRLNDLREQRRLITRELALWSSLESILDRLIASKRLRHSRLDHRRLQLEVLIHEYRRRQDRTR